jgi:hypothetical protein
MKKYLLIEAQHGQMTVVKACDKTEAMACKVDYHFVTTVYDATAGFAIVDALNSAGL